MRLVALLNPAGAADAGSAADAGHWRELARAAERGRFDAVWVGDRLAADPAAERPAGGLEPLTLLAALAGATSRIGLLASASTTFHEPFHLARMIASLDHISHGRIGWHVAVSGSGRPRRATSAPTRRSSAASATSAPRSSSTWPRSCGTVLARPCCAARVGAGPGTDPRGRPPRTVLQGARTLDGPPPAAGLAGPGRQRGRVGGEHRVRGPLRGDRVHGVDVGVPARRRSPGP